MQQKKLCTRLFQSGKGAAIKKTLSTLFVASIVLVLLTVSSEGYVDATISPHSGSIRITPTGVVEGTEKISRNGNVYTLTGDISGTAENGRTFLSIERDGVTLDGVGHTISGTGTGVAIYAMGKTDITIKNTRIVNFGTGIELRMIDFESGSTSSNNQILGNYLENEYWGMDLNTLNGKVTSNTIMVKKGIYGVNFQSNGTTFTDNVFINGGLAVFNQGLGNVFSGNTINGKPLVYIDGRSNQVIDGAGQVILVNCNSMVIRNVQDTVDLRQTIQLFGTTNTKITNSKGNIALTNSDSNTITNNELSEVGSMANYDSAALTLTRSNNNTVSQNKMIATNANGAILAGSSYNAIEKNRISVSGADRAAIRLETLPQSSCEYNYIHDNSLTSQDNGIYFRNGAKNNNIFSNVITGCENGLSLFSAYYNQFYANNITGCTKNGVYFSISDYNSFFHNNFVNNVKQVQENHQLYWWGIQNDTYYSENNKWDNGKEGNFWSDYTGVDANGDGIGETLYTVYENYVDHYPLTTPYDIGDIPVEYEEWFPPLQIMILSPQNVTYNASSVNLTLTVSQQTSWLAYSTDSQSNITINGNTTLIDLASGTHTITVYANNTQGATAASDTITFYVDTNDTNLILTVAAGSGAIVAAITVAGLLLHRRKKPTLKPEKMS
jgi:nitrous oxidase accessory protein NosD